MYRTSRYKIVIIIMITYTNNSPASSLFPQTPEFLATSSHGTTWHLSSQGWNFPPLYENRLCLFLITIRFCFWCGRNGYLWADQVSQPIQLFWLACATMQWYERIDQVKTNLFPEGFWEITLLSGSDGSWCHGSFWLEGTHVDHCLLTLHLQSRE